MNNLKLVRGLPGSGKTTEATKMAAKYGFKVIEADMYFVRDGEYRFNPELIGEAHEWCQKTCKEHLTRGETVIVSNTFTEKWEMVPYLDMAKNLGLDVEVIECTGQYGSVHGVPEQALLAMKNRWEECWSIEADIEDLLGKKITYTVI